MTKFSFAATFPILSLLLFNGFYQFVALLRNFDAMKTITYVLLVGYIIFCLVVLNRNELDRVKVVYGLKAFIDFGNSRPKRIKTTREFNIAAESS